MSHGAGAGARGSWCASALVHHFVIRMLRLKIWYSDEPLTSKPSIADFIN